MDDFKADLLKLVQRDKPGAVEITDWEEDSRMGGYCETCSYDYIVVEVTFKCENCDQKDHLMSHRDHMWEYQGNLAELMRALVYEY
jgi:hypothetical protein